VRPQEPVGSLGEEAVRLVEALRDWADRHGDGSSARPPEDSERPAARTGGTRGELPCRVCPVCQVIDVLRQVRPEAMDHLADAATALAAALRELAGPAGQDGTGRRAAGVQHIDIG
jgi:hypothetical protein